ncbi:hypothetical protein MJM04_30540, partial [Salmonella enterica subsp. enterica serovar Cerro]|nr:hypothetical protein [Salmonella enterica subsp. enterica serovar Cerro]
AEIFSDPAMPQAEALSYLLRGQGLDSNQSDSAAMTSMLIGLGGAGNTALCTVGKSGNDLHYRGYDILDLAEHCEFEEVAHLLIHG